MDCPFCSEEIADSAKKCKHCGEFLDEPEPQSSSGVSVVVIVVVVVFGLICLVSCLAAIAIPNLIEARKSGNESAAIGALKTLSVAQSLFRESDKEGDSVLDYGTLQELGYAGNTGLIDSVLASGTKQGYIFECTYSSTTPEFLWMATARPALPTTTGDRFFAINQEGIIYYTTSGPFPLDDVECKITGGTPVGR